MHKNIESKISETEVSELRYKYHLDYIISENRSKLNNISEKKIAVVAHVNYPKLIEYCLDYIAHIPDYIDVYITTKGECNIQTISKRIELLRRKNIKIVEPQDRGREISALLVACKEYLVKYDYLCFVHDKKKNKGEPYITVGQSFCDLLWENTLKNATYIENVISTLENEERLGILSPPAPYDSFFFTVGFFPWCDCFDQTYKLAKRLKLKCIIDEKRQPFIVGTTFWCKTRALKPLFEANLSFEDFSPEPMPEGNTISHAIERILPYVAQSQGYYSGIMMTEEYASIYKSNYKLMLKKLANSINAHNGNSFAASINNNEKIKSFIGNSADIYIYGAGKIGQSCFHTIKDISPNTNCVFVVSKKTDDDYVQGCKVIAIDELGENNEIALILAMKTEFVTQVLPVVKKIGIKNIMIFQEDLL